MEMAKVSELQENLEKKNIKFDDIVDNDTKGMKNKLLFLWALIGPGFLAAIGDNDAGGLISYSVTGMKFGISLFIPLSICLVIITYTVQEMSMRLSVVTQTGFTSLIKKYYGNLWIKYHITTICMENILMLTTEFIGMSAGLVVLGLPMWVSVLISLVLVLSVITMAGYWTKERLTLFIGFFNIVFIIIAFMTHPSIKNIAYTFIAWNYPKESQNLFWYIVAIIGNAVAPWMIFFQGNACIDKGIVKDHIRLGRIDTTIGCIVQVVIAACVIISGAALFGQVNNIETLGPAQLILTFSSHMGRTAGILFGIGLFNAGFMAAITISLSTTWCVSEAFGWKQSLNSKLSEAPKFYGVYIGSVVIAACIVLIPNLHLNYITLLTQVISGFLMAPILIFLVMLTNKKELMGEYKNNLFINIRACIVAAILIVMAVLLIFNSI